VSRRRPRRGERDRARDLPAALSLDPGHQGRQVDRERPGQPVDVDHAHIATPTLHVADVTGVEAGLLRETFLREPALKPERPDGLAE
jgi:hypothetical protein